LLPLARFCGRQERCRQEVKDKLNDWEIFGEQAEKLIERLEDEGLLDEARFARMFASGRFRIKKWGRRKIEQHLKAKRVITPLIREALDALDEDDYRETIKELARKKSALNTYESDFERRGKIGQYLIRKGFEQELVWAILDD